MNIEDAILEEKDVTLKKVAHFSCVTRETRKGNSDGLDILGGDGYHHCCSFSTLTRNMRKSEFGKYRVTVTIILIHALCPRQKSNLMIFGILKAWPLVI